MINNYKYNKGLEKILISPIEYEDNTNNCNPKGFINIDEFIKAKKIDQNQYWKFYTVTKKNKDITYTAKMSTIKIQEFTKIEKENLIKEVEILTSLNHPSLLKIIGYSKFNFKKCQKPVIITEYASKQTLRNVINATIINNKYKDFNKTKLHIVLFEIASGMVYLHSNNILHQNLTPDNIVLNDEFHPKLTDYGNYIKLQILKSVACQSLSKMQNNPHYKAPELLKSENTTKACDVYSFGMIMLELLIKKKPFSDYSTYKTMKYIIDNNIKICNIYEQPEEEDSLDDTKISDCYKEMIESCLLKDPNLRPTFESITNSLKHDIRFFENGVNKEEFLRYVNLIENNNQKRNETNVFLTHQEKSQHPQSQKTFVPSSLSKPKLRKENTNNFELSIAYDEVRDDKSGINWILTSFDDLNKNWKFCGKGKGGLNEMKSSIPSYFAGYCYLRTNSYIRGIKRTIFILAKFITKNVKMMTKAQMNANRGEIEKNFSYTNKSLEISSLDELSDEIN